MATEPQRYASRSAYTLVELVIVVLVVGILMRVAAPKYMESLAVYRSDTAARRVAADLRLARSYAQKVSAAQQVDFDAAAETYAMSVTPDVDRSGSMYMVNLYQQNSAVITSATFGPGDAVQFDMYGRPDRAGSVVIQAGTRQKTVEVDAVGNVRIL